jgi:hypothetical protein
MIVKLNRKAGQNPPWVVRRLKKNIYIYIYSGTSVHEFNSFLYAVRHPKMFVNRIYAYWAKVKQQLTLFRRYSQLVANRCCRLACSLLETPFVTRDVFFFGKFFREPICYWERLSWTEVPLYEYISPTKVLTQPQYSDKPPNHGHFLKDFTHCDDDVSEHMLYEWPWTTVFFTPDDGYGKYPKHVDWSCNKIRILVLRLVGRLYIYIYLKFCKDICD